MRTAKSMLVAGYMSRFVRTVGADQTVATARRILRDHDLDRLPVLNAGDLVGVIAGEDIANAVIERGGDVSGARVDAVMRAQVLVVGPDTQLADAAKLMSDAGQDACVVVEDGCVVGMLTAAEAMRGLIGPTGQRPGAPPLGRA